MKSSDHFENIQSTNWQTVRFKPPTPGSSIGWRVEFRTMEVQLTDFENAAFTVFIALVSRALLYFNLNFYIPLSKVDENLKRAHKVDAVLEETFWWRKNVKVCADSKPGQPENDEEDAYAEMSIRDILLGSPDALDAPTSSNPGLLNLVRTYLDMIECDALTRRIVDAYLDLISSRATGELMTAAAWLRKFASVHPAYEHNSLLNQEIVFDMVEAVNQIVRGTLEVPQLLGTHNNLPKTAINAEGEMETRNIELKGANKRSSSSAACSSSAASTSSAEHSLDLTEVNCCEKLRSFLLPYLQQASSKPSMGSRTSSTTNIAAAAPQTPNGKATGSSSSTAAAWTSPPPQPSA